LNQLELLDILPFKELIVLNCLLMLSNVHKMGQIEAKSNPGNPCPIPELKLKKGEKRTLPMVENGSTLKIEAQNELPPDVVEFMSLPPQTRKQLLRYGAKWTEALFVPKT
jgi:TusA-related sulfurtransferase